MATSMSMQFWSTDDTQDVLKRYLALISPVLTAEQSCIYESFHKLHIEFFRTFYTPNEPLLAVFTSYVHASYILTRLTVS